MARLTAIASTASSCGREGNLPTPRRRWEDSAHEGACRAPAPLRSPSLSGAISSLLLPYASKSHMLEVARIDTGAALSVGRYDHRAHRLIRLSISSSGVAR